jgi:hypothetical protein
MHVPSLKIQTMKETHQSNDIIMTGQLRTRRQSNAFYLHAAVVSSLPLGAVDGHFWQFRPPVARILSIPTHTRMPAGGRRPERKLRVKTTALVAVDNQVPRPRALYGQGDAPTDRAIHGCVQLECERF